MPISAHEGKLLLAACLWLFVLCRLSATNAAEKSDATQVIAVANTPGSALHEAITSTFDAKDLKEGTGRGSDFFFALQSISRPQLFIDAAPGPQMQLCSQAPQFGMPAMI
jgi:hypothetical protein